MKRRILAAAALTVGCGTAPSHRDATDNVNIDPPSEIAAESFALAGTKGNGGDAVVCFDSLEMRKEVYGQLTNNNGSTLKINPFKSPDVMRHVSKIEIFDLFEYRLPSGFPPVQRELRAMIGTFQEDLPKVIERLRSVSSFADRLDEELNEMPLTNWRQAEAVVEIDDSGEVFYLPPECLLVQAAVRQDNQVFYDSYLWNGMDQLNRLALVVHELVYKVAVENNQSTSEKARQAVGMILSKSDLQSMSGWQVYEKLRSLGSYEFSHAIAGNPLRVKKVFATFPTGEPKSMFVVSAKPIKYGDQTFHLDLSDANNANISLATLEQLESLKTTETYGSNLYFRSPGVVVQFEKDKVSHVKFVSSAAVLTEPLEQSWTEVQEIHFKYTDGIVMSVNGQSTFETAAGTVITSGTVISRNGMIDHSSYGRLVRPNITYEGSDLNFDSNGQIINFHNVKKWSDSCTYGPAFVVAGSLRLRVCESDLEFFPSGSVKSIKYRNSSSDTTGLITWSTSGQHIDGVLSLIISEDGSEVTGTTGAFGSYYDSHRQQKNVPMANQQFTIKNDVLTQPSLP